MQLFYEPFITSPVFELNEEESHHLTKVLRKKEKDIIQVLNGKGKSFECEIIEVGKKKVRVSVCSEKAYVGRDKYLHIAIAPTKNIDRLEWFLEKATEIGVEEISLLITEKSERREIKNMERLEKILISSIKQSVQFHLPQLNPPQKISEFLKTVPAYSKYIAFCEEAPKLALKDLNQQKKALVLIGPEGDFTKNEVDLCFKLNFQALSLGSNRLRTETAGIMVSAAFSL